MYAVLRSGGKQYKVQAGDSVRVEKLEKKLGEEFDLTDILLIGGEKTIVGTPTVAKAKVTVVVTQQDKGPRILIVKKKRRHGYRRQKGHRQLFTELFVKAITSPDGQVAKADKEAHVIDPAKKEARVAEFMKKQAAEGNKPKAKKAAPAKKAKTAKKAAGKKKATKKAGAKKKASKSTKKSKK